MPKFVLVLYLCSQLSGQCPSHHYPGVSFETHTACVEYGYRAAYGTFNQLEKNEEFTKEYIENREEIDRDSESIIGSINMDLKLYEFVLVNLYR